MNYWGKSLASVIVIIKITQAIQRATTTKLARLVRTGTLRKLKQTSAVSQFLKDLRNTAILFLPHRIDALYAPSDSFINQTVKGSGLTASQMATGKGKIPASAIKDCPHRISGFGARIFRCYRIAFNRVGRSKGRIAGNYYKGRSGFLDSCGRFFITGNGQKQGYKGQKQKFFHLFLSGLPSNGGSTGKLTPQFNLSRGFCG